MEKFFLVLISCLLPYMLAAQNPIDKGHLNIDTTGQKDLIDIGRSLVKSKRPRPIFLDEKKKIYFSILPISTSIPGGGTALSYIYHRRFLPGRQKHYISFKYYLCTLRQFKRAIWHAHKVEYLVK